VFGFFITHSTPSTISAYNPLFHENRLRVFSVGTTGKRFMIINQVAKTMNKKGQKRQ
jgi:hypothetical protein